MERKITKVKTAPTFDRGKEQKSISQGSIHASHGAAAYDGNAQHVGSDVPGKMAGRDIIETKIYHGTGKPELKEKEIKQLYETYRRDLLEYARDKAVISNIYSGRKFSIVKLQITSTEQQSQNKEGFHLHHRAYRAELMSRKIVGDVEVDKLFEKAKELAEEKALQTDFQNIPNAREKFIQKEGNRVIISGQAGSGKTTLSKSVLGKVVGKEQLFDIDLVCYLVLRGVNYGEKLSFLKFLAPTVSYDSNQQKAILARVNDSDKVLIIMDGLDESNIDFTTPHQNVRLDDEATAEVFIKNLLKGSILPNAKILIFSRPRTVAELPDQYKAILVATILGLNDDAQQQICKDICKENSEKVFQYIQNNANLLAYCQTPLNLILAAHAINETAPNNSTEIHTFTNVLVFTLQRFVKNTTRHRGNFDAKSISSLAWNGFKIGKFTFSLKDFNEDFNKDNLFIAINETSKLALLNGDLEIKVCFSHLVLQEFFAALHLLYFMELEEFLENGENLTSTEFDIVTKILFGLCNEKSNEKIKIINPSCFYPQEKVEFLKNMLKLEPYGDIDEEVLRYFLWAYELNDDSLTQKLANCLSDRVDVSCRMLPSDIAAFHYVCGMREQQSITFRSLSSGNFYRDCWHLFLSDEKLHHYLKKMEELSLKKCEISDDATLALAQCSHNIQRLNLEDCNLTIIGWKRVFDGVVNMNEKMEKLNLKKCEISDDATLALAQCSHNIQRLTMQFCNLTIIGWKRVFDGVANMNEKIDELVLECYEGDLPDELVDEYKARLESKVTNLTININQRINASDLNLSEIIKESDSDGEF